MKQCVIFISLFFAFGLTGCNNATDTQLTQKPKPSTEDTAEKASTTQAPPTSDSIPTLKVAMTGKGVPLTFNDAKGNLTGIDLDIIRAVGELEGFNVVPVPEKWENLFTNVELGKYDIALSGISWTAERAGKYGLSNGYFFNPASFTYNSKKLTNKPKKLSDLSGLKVGVLKGSKHEKTLSTVPNIKLQVSTKSFDNLNAMAQGDLDVMVHDYLNLKQYQHDYPKQNLVIETFETPDEKSAYLVMVTKKDNTDLLNKLNSGIAKLQKDGTIDKIVAKYIDK
ncbi:extracellular solute-binding protein [Moraxella macacae 0408225]|uniref:Extracellular solute-binding protein n=1 Tax=Moraxella macacae 0408225 TaxID=1230338 RepID=L2F5D2_9GAMM|nr:transporter substrate-binding domain-containing protein [Moraxella macacae]ELA08264.1 extracellular solute-binding protein [Moraxella macacae 0408225]